MKSRKHTKKTHRRHRGGGYGFGGSILSDAGGAGAGNALWSPDTSKDCGVVPGRAGNNLAGGRRRRMSRRHRGGMATNAQLADRGGQNKIGGRRRKTLRKRKTGGAYVDYAQMVPRAGYTFTGQGVGGTADAVPY